MWCYVRVRQQEVGEERGKGLWAELGKYQPQGERGTDNGEIEEEKNEEG